LTVVRVYSHKNSFVLIEPDLSPVTNTTNITLPYTSITSLRSHEQILLSKKKQFNLSTSICMQQGKVLPTRTPRTKRKDKGKGGVLTLPYLSLIDQLIARAIRRRLCGFFLFDLPPHNIRHFEKPSSLLNHPIPLPLPTARLPPALETG